MSLPEHRDVQPRPCEVCGGAGRVGEGFCLKCNGTGKLWLDIGRWWQVRTWGRRKMEYYPRHNP